MSVKIFLGCDPGLTGAVAALDSSGRYMGFFDLPTVEKETKSKGKTKAKVKRQIDGLELYNQLLSLCDLDVSEVVMVLEAQTSMARTKKNKKTGKIEEVKNGVSSLMSLGHTYGMLEAAIQISGIKYTKVHPKTWKKFYNIPGGDDGKKYALTVARMMFRDAPLKRVKDHNRAEALLLARYGFDHYVEDA